MIEINKNVKDYHSCSLCDDGTKATHSIVIKVATKRSYEMRTCDYHVWKFISDAEEQGRKYYGEVK